MVLYVPGEDHGSDWLGMETLFEACRNRELSISRLAPYLGKLARYERNHAAGADGVRWLEVVRGGSAVCALGTGALIEFGGTNRTAAETRRKTLRFRYVESKKGPPNSVSPCELLDT